MVSIIYNIQYVKISENFGFFQNNSPDRFLDGVL